MNLGSMVRTFGALTMLLAACAPAATPSPTAAPAKPETAKPAATTAAAPPPAATAPPAPAAKPALEEKGSGKLTVLASPQPDWVQAQVQAFQDKFKVETSFVRKSGGESLAQLKAESGNPSFDVWWGSPIDSFIAAKNEGLLEPYVPPSAAEILSKYKDPQGAWHGIYLGSIGWAVNTRRLEEKKLPEPRTWDDLIKPEYKGEIVMAHPATSGTALTTIATILQTRGEDKGWEWVKDFHKNVLQYTRSGSGPMRMIDGSEATIGVVFSHDIFVSVEKGLPIKIVFPQDGTGYEVGGMALVKGAKNPVEAKKWIDWALTAEAQEIGATVKAYQAPTNPRAKVPKPEFMQVKLMDYDFDWVGNNEAKIRQRYLDEIAPAPRE
jgi:iron(III) transport system substrate-binding protein